MTPEQKLKHLIIARHCAEGRALPSPITAENIDRIYEDMEEDDGEGYGLQDARSEVREGEVETKLPCEWSRHYESKAVAAKALDGSWIGWTYWYGGGKHGEPEAVDWIEDAYALNCVEEEKTVTVQTFSKVD